MKRHTAVVLILSLLLVGIVPNADADPGATVSIHDVKILGVAVTDLNTGQSTVSNQNCVEFYIGTPSGTTYTSGNVSITISGADNQNYARIIGVENGATSSTPGCSSDFTSDSNRDQLILRNTKIVINNTNSVNQPLTVETSGDFGPTPNSSTTFAGYGSGIFYNGANKTSCLGYGCQGSYSGTVTLITSPSTSTSIPQVTCNPPFSLGACNLNTGLSQPLDMGTTNNRTQHWILTAKLPGTVYWFKTNDPSYIEVKKGPPPKDTRTK
jgi:hypothetical protein